MFLIMPIDYKKYPKNWKSEIRPMILKRAKNKCEICGLPNYEIISRGVTENKVDVYQLVAGDIYLALNSDLIYDCDSEPNEEIEFKMAIKIILTIAHLNHNINDNRADNLKAMCQRCHLRYDAKHHAETRKKHKNKLQMSFDL